MIKRAITVPNPSTSIHHWRFWGTANRANLVDKNVVIGLGCQMVVIRPLSCSEVDTIEMNFAFAIFVDPCRIQSF